MSFYDIETNLKKLNYKELEDQMSSLPSNVILELVKSASIKVGDTAASLLARRGETTIVAESVLQNKFKNRFSKLRATYILSESLQPENVATAAVFHLIYDKSREVASNALFSVVASRNGEFIESLRRVELDDGSSEWLKERVKVAIEALERGDPKIYSPNFGG